MSILPLHAQTRLSVDECKAMAVEHNVRTRNARNAVSAAGEQLKEAFTSYFPTVSAAGLGLNADKGMVSMELQPGMELSLLKSGVSGSVTAMQPVFAGGRIVNGNKLARLGVDVSRLQMRQAENEVEKTAEQYYWQVVMLQEKMRAVEAVDSMLSRLCADVANSAEAGIALRNDLLQAQLRRNELESSRSSLANGIALSRMLLAQYIGLAPSVVAPTAQIPVGTMPDDPSKLLVDHRSALLSTPEYGLLEKNVSAAELQRKITVGESLPSVAVGAGYLYNNFMDKGRSFGLVMATASVPISGWWGGSHAIKRRKIEAESARNSLEDNSQLLVIRMRNAWNELDNAYRQLSIACRSIEQSAENLRLNADCYRAGTTTMTDLLQAQTLYQQSRDRYVEAFADYQTRRTEYLQATGR